MNNNTSNKSNRLLIMIGLGVALGIAIFVSPFASRNPDGLDRVSQDLKFDHKAKAETPAQKLPFYAIFEEYTLRGVPEAVATPLAGLAGTLVTFGIALGIGKLVIKPTPKNKPSTTDKDG